MLLRCHNPPPPHPPSMSPSVPPGMHLTIPQTSSIGLMNHCNSFSNTASVRTIAPTRAAAITAATTPTPQPSPTPRNSFADATRAPTVALTPQPPSPPPTTENHPTWQANGLKFVQKKGLAHWKKNGTTHWKENGKTCWMVEGVVRLKVPCVAVPLKPVPSKPTAQSKPVKRTSLQVSHENSTVGTFLRTHAIKGKETKSCKANERPQDKAADFRPANPVSHNKRKTPLLATKAICEVFSDGDVKNEHFLFDWKG